MTNPRPPGKSELSTLHSAFAYSTDAWQRAILYLNTMRKRAGQYEEHANSSLQTYSTMKRN